MGKGPACRGYIYHAMKPELHSTSKGELSKVEGNERKILFQERPLHLLYEILKCNFEGKKEEKY